MPFKVNPRVQVLMILELAEKAFNAYWLWHYFWRPLSDEIFKYIKHL